VLPSLVPLVTTDLMSAPQPPSLSELSFEQALAELETIVRALESGQAPLEQSIVQYERGAALKAHCEAKLAAARLRVEKIVIGSGGEPSLTPADFG